MCLLKEVVYSYEKINGDMCALKLQRGIDNPGTPYDMVRQVQACRCE
jgi:hypothetical protein